MNKYQEALNRLSNIDLQQYGEDPFDDGRLTPLYACDCYRREFDTLLELADKQEKYKWHDLRKDPNDLPTRIGVPLVLYFLGSYCDGFLNGFKKIVIDGFIFEPSEVIAWKYIEELDDE